MCAARDAVLFLREQPGRIEAKRQLAVMRARREVPAPRGGVTDPTARIDDLIQSEMDAEREASEAARAVEDAMAVLRGLGRIDPGGASVLRMRYMMTAPWRSIAEACGLSYDEVRAMESRAMDMIDANGIAAIRAGETPVTGN